MAYKVSNNAFSTLAGAINSIVTSLTVGTGHGDRFPVITGADHTFVTLEDASGNIEIVKVTARASASDVMTIVRAQDGTTARSWASGDVIECRVIAALLNDAIAHVGDTTDAHAASAITNTPAGNIAATTVQAALNELDSELSAAISTANSNLTSHLNDTADAHDASAISYVGGTGMSATDVEAAIDELANEKLNLTGGTVTGDIIMSGASIITAEGADVTAAATTDIWATDGNTRHVTGNTTIASFGTAPQAGARMKLIFDGTPLITAGANLILNGGGSNIQIEAGDTGEAYADTTTQIRLTITKASGASVVSSNQLQSLTASVSAGALTITYNGGTLQFRNPTLTDGAPVSAVIASNSITVPSTATLGDLVAGVDRHIVLEAYNGGSPVLCVANFSGGLNFDETNLISPTTISGTSNSASTIYSASAVSANSPYRIVGFVDCETSAPNWTSPTLVQGAGGNKIYNGLNSIRVHTDNGFGSTNTAIRKFSNVAHNLGTAITYTSSATDGDSFTINESGIYAVSFSDNFSVAAHIGISLNSSQLTTSISAINIADCLSLTYTPSGAAAGAPSWTGYLKAGDVIRPHCGVSLTNSTVSGETFSIAKVG